MLTRDLLRFRVADGRIAPRLLKATPAIVVLAERLAVFWRDVEGQERGAIEEALQPLLHGTRSLLVARGLSRLLEQEGGWSEPASCAALRARVFPLSAAMLGDHATPEAHRAAVAAAAGEPATALERLYGDLPDAERLERAPRIEARDLLDRYNLAQCQGLLLGARALEVEVDDADTGLRRRLLKAVRFRRLLCEVRAAPAGALALTISGPASVLDQATRYGLQLALFLPALACARSWRARARIPQRGGGSGSAPELLLSHEDGLRGDTAFLGHVPEELRALESALAGRLDGWTSVEPAPLPLPSGELVVPDLRLERGGRGVSIELFHRWHEAPLKRRLAQLRDGALPGLMLGVDRALARTTRCAPLVADALFASRGFLFSDVPSARAIGEAVERGAPA